GARKSALATALHPFAVTCWSFIIDAETRKLSRRFAKPMVNRFGTSAIRAILLTPTAITTVHAPHHYWPPTVVTRLALRENSSALMSKPVLSFGSMTRQPSGPFHRRFSVWE